MGRSDAGHRSLMVAVRFLRALGYVSARVLQLLLATLASMSEKANAPLLPPDTNPTPRREDYRP